MRTTLDLPQQLMEEAIKVSHCQTKTEVIQVALKNLIQQERVREIKKFRGKVRIKIDLDRLRDR
ncbi:MAG: type II toxin-antitoxin system VapB family antitoxin [Fibrobacterota bacterium]